MHAPTEVAKCGGYGTSKGSRAGIASVSVEGAMAHLLKSCSLSVCADLADAESADAAARQSLASTKMAQMESVSAGSDAKAKAAIEKYDGMDMGLGNAITLEPQ